MLLGGVLLGVPGEKGEIIESSGGTTEKTLTEGDACTRGELLGRVLLGGLLGVLVLLGGVPTETGKEWLEVGDELSPLAGEVLVALRVIARSRSKSPTSDPAMLGELAENDAGRFPPRFLLGWFLGSRYVPVGEEIIR